MKTATARSLELEENAPAKDDEPISVEEKFSRLLNQLDRKLSEKSSLENKFDVLMYKVEKIEESQDKIIDQLSGLHDAVYDPDKGLFSRIKEVQQENNKELSIIENIKSVQEEEKKN